MTLKELRETTTKCADAQTEEDVAHSFAEARKRISLREALPPDVREEWERRIANAVAATIQ